MFIYDLDLIFLQNAESIPLASLSSSMKGARLVEGAHPMSSKMFLVMLRSSPTATKQGKNKAQWHRMTMVQSVL